MDVLSTIRVKRSRLSRRQWATAFAAVAATVTLVQIMRYRAARFIGNPRVPQPTKDVDLDRYAGRWYELARYENRFERDCEGVTADYTVRQDGLVDVMNVCRERGTGRAQRFSHGRAKVVPESRNSKLKVSFFGPFFWGDYWVLDHDDDYSWSIVGEPSGRFLWILCRDALPSNERYEELIRRARALGYDTSRVRRTQQYAI